MSSFSFPAFPLSRFPVFPFSRFQKTLEKVMWIGTITGFFARSITVFQSKYLNNIVEQDHRFIKKITRPMLGFKSFACAEGEATLAGIELHHIIRKGQLDLEEATPFEQFYALAG
jgi:putative transposase